MRKRNRMVTAQMRGFEKYGFGQMPKGEIARISVNPYNGKIVIVFNDCEKYEDAINDVLAQVSQSLRRIRMCYGAEGALHRYADACDAGRAESLERVTVSYCMREGNEAKAFAS